VLCDSECPHCASYEKNESHCFFGCVTSQEVWKETPMWNQIHAYVTNTDGIVLFKMLDEINVANLSHIAMLIWICLVEEELKVLASKNTNCVRVNTKRKRVHKGKTAAAKQW
jgi:hypothetical protein